MRSSETDAASARTPALAGASKHEAGAHQLVRIAPAYYGTRSTREPFVRRLKLLPTQSRSVLRADERRDMS